MVDAVFFAALLLFVLGGTGDLLASFFFVEALVVSFFFVEALVEEGVLLGVVEEAPKSEEKNVGGFPTSSLFDEATRLGFDLELRTGLLDTTVAELEDFLLAVADFGVVSPLLGFAPVDDVFFAFLAIESSFGSSVASLLRFAGVNLVFGMLNLNLGLEKE